MDADARSPATARSRVLLIEQNLGVAIDVAETIDVMVNGRIARSLPAAELAADRELQQQLLGVRVGPEDEPERGRDRTRGRGAAARVHRAPRRATARAGEPAPHESRARCAATRAGTRPTATAQPRDRLVDARAAPPTARRRRSTDAAERLAETGRDARVVEFPVAASAARAAYIAGTFDTKGRELLFLKGCLDKLGVRTVTVDLATSGKPSPAMVHPREVARHHPNGERAVFTDDRGSSVDGDGGGVRALRRRATRSRRHHLGRRLRRHRARDCRDARPADRRAQGHGVDGRIGRRQALRRARRTSA